MICDVERLVLVHLARSASRSWNPGQIGNEIAPEMRASLVVWLVGYQSNPPGFGNLYVLDRVVRVIGFPLPNRWDVVGADQTRHIGRFAKGLDQAPTGGVFGPASGFTCVGKSDDPWPTFFESTDLVGINAN